MIGFKLVIGFKNGQCVQKEVPESASKALLGKKIGSKISGVDIGFDGYEFEITGGSDYAGFPMRKDLTGVGRKRILAVKGVGIKKKAKGIRQRKTVCGNTIHQKISQVNVKVLKEGKEKLIIPKEKKEETPGETQKAEEKSKEEKPKEANA